MMEALAVAIGGALGSVCLVAVWLGARLGASMA